MSRNVKLDDLTPEQLLESYVKAGLEEEAAYMRGRLSQYNRLAKQGFEIAAELGWRPGNQRLSLLRLYNHPNMRVKYNAARDTWFVANIESRRKLEEIGESKWQPYCAEAAMQIRILDGEYEKKPSGS